MTTRKAPGSKRSHGALRIWTLEGQRRFPGKKFAGESPPSSLMANKEVEFHEAASEEFAAAFDWYWERSAGAAARFAGEMSRAVASIAEAPQRWPTGIHGTRKFLLGRFPFHHSSAGRRARPSAARLLERPTLRPPGLSFLTSFPRSFPACSSGKTDGRSLPAASACTASRRALRSLADKRPSRKSWRRKSAAGRPLFRELQPRQQETRLRNKLVPDCARGKKWTRQCARRGVRRRQ